MEKAEILSLLEKGTTRVVSSFETAAAIVASGYDSSRLTSRSSDRIEFLKPMRDLKARMMHEINKMINHVQNELENPDEFSQSEINDILSEARAIAKRSEQMMERIIKKHQLRMERH